MNILQSRQKTPGEKLAFLLATGLGVGLIPMAPGTFGSLWGLLLAAGLQAMGLHWGVHLGAIFLILALGIPICGTAAKLFPSKDPGAIVYDEFASLLLVFIAIPFTWRTALIGFLLFRLFDIWKPWPVRRLETLPGGLGVMADDVGAAILAAGALWLGMWWTGLA
ncbi:MAG: phosphatidylglycerophosphatase A [Planctomycetaceae bacterium]